MVINEVLPVCATFINPSDDIMMKKCPEKFTEEIWVSWQWAQWKPYFTQSLKWLCICTFSVLFWLGYISPYRIWTCSSAFVGEV